MRYVCIVLVPLCFGLTSGFIVPPGVQEILTDLQDNLNTVHSSASKTRSLFYTDTKNDSLTYSTKTNKSIPVDKTNDSLHLDIYEHIQPKDSDIKERSFIYINQKMKKPLRNRLYDTLARRHYIDSNTHNSYLLHINNIFEEIPRQYSISYLGEKIYNTNVEISSKPDYRCHTKSRNDMQQNSNAKSNPQTIIKVPSEQREYLELLKAPLLRPAIKDNDQGIKRPENNILNYKPTDLQKGKNAYLRLNPTEVQNVNTAEIQNRVQSEPGMGNQKENASEDDLIIDIFGRKTDHNIAESDKLQLVNLVNNGFTDSQLDRKDNNTLNKNDYHFCLDCINKARKHKLSSRLHLEAKCKCAHNVIYTRIK